MSRLAVFDIDGTLTDTHAVDDECYRAAIAPLLRSQADAIAWETAPHISDVGIACWLWRQVHARDPSTAELAGLRDDFVARLATQSQSAPNRFASIPGAGAAIDHLRTAGWSVAIATGGWSQSARLKLKAAQINVASIPFASSDDASARADIVRAAVRRVEGMMSSRVERVVSIGDAPWDVACARELGYAFVGIGTGEGATRLRSAGASIVLADYLDVSRFAAALDAAVVPGSPAPVV